MPEKLTKRFVESIKPGDREIIKWDTEIRGFGVRVQPSGRRTYILKYRTLHGTVRKPKIGVHGDLTVEQARTIAGDWKQAVRRGKDPSAERQAARQAPTVADLAADYLQRHALPHKRPASVSNDRSMLDRLILPRLGKMKVVAVTRRDVEAIHAGLRAKPYVANRVVALLSKMFNLAAAWGWRDGNPARGIPRFHEDRRERWLSADELTRLWAALEAYPRRPAANAVKLLALTGARRGEVLSATWEEFDLDRGIWTKPSHHTKQKRTEHVPLNGPAMSLLEALRAEASAGQVHLFPGDAPGKPIANIQRLWRRVCRDAGLEGVRLHDLRHTYASSLVSGGVSLHIVGRLLGHTQPQTTARYAHLDDHALREATNGFGRLVEAAGQGRAAEVVEWMGRPPEPL